jgi:hypothetical protein
VIRTLNVEITLHIKNITLNIKKDI